MLPSKNSGIWLVALGALPHKKLWRKAILSPAPALAGACVITPTAEWSN